MRSAEAQITSILSSQRLRRQLFVTMGNVFGEKPLKEVLRENQRMIKKAIRELEKEIRTLESNEKKLIADIKKSAKGNQMGAMKVMAKDLVRTRKYIEKFIEMKTHLNAVALKMQVRRTNRGLDTANNAHILANTS